MKKIMFNDRFFLTESVLAGRKYQTRRIINPQPHLSDNGGIAWQGYLYGLSLPDTIEGAYRNFISGIKYDKDIHIPFHKGDIVAIAQSYRNSGYLENTRLPCSTPGKPSFFLAGDSKGWDNKMFVSPRLMQHQIQITDMRIEKLQDISYSDCIAEGIIKIHNGCYTSGVAEVEKCSFGQLKHLKSYNTAREAYADLIDSISGKGTWESNPFVWVYEFKVLKFHGFIP